MNKNDNKEKQEKIYIYPFLPEIYLKLNLNETELDIFITTIFYFENHNDCYQSVIVEIVKQLSRKYNVCLILKCINEFRLNQLICESKNALTYLGERVYNYCLENLNEYFYINNLNGDDIFKIFKLTEAEIGFLSISNGQMILKKDIENFTNIRSMYIKEILLESKEKSYIIEKESFQKKSEDYKSIHQEWKLKMNKIKELQEIYDEEQFPNIPEPKKPTFEKKLDSYIILSEFGNQLYEFIKNNKPELLE